MKPKPSEVTPPGMAHVVKALKDKPSVVIVEGTCVFLDEFGRCSLQVTATERNLHKWTWKPMLCVLYPIVISDKTIRFDDLLQDEQSCCTIQSGFDLPLYEACREELEYLVGKDGLALSEEHYRSLAK